MIIIDKTIVSDELVDEYFACALDKCKGGCCVQGESGAPLEPEETGILEEIYEKVSLWMTDEGKVTVQQSGKWMVDGDGDFVTPLVNGNKQCAYAFFENGIAKCAIEKAYDHGMTNFRKPISCHLYPVRITKYSGYDAINYNRWEICSPACSSGRKKGIYVYRFVKEALVRKYGIEWYTQLEGAVGFKSSSNPPKSDY